MGFFKHIIDRLTWKKRLCCKCSHLYSAVHETSPCARCKQGSEFKKYDFNIIFSKKENDEMTKQQYHDRNVEELTRIIMEMKSGTGDKDLLNLEYMLYSIEMGDEFYKKGCVKTLRKAIELMKKSKADKEQNEAFAAMEGK